MSEPRRRLESLDIFRGLTVAGMILVSTPGTWTAVYWPLDHAAWNGWTPTDLVFPFFLFAMGAAVPFATGRRKAAAAPLTPYVLRRAVLLFALGLVLNAIEAGWPPSLATFRIPGVLQRIAIVYAAVVAITEAFQPAAQIAIASAMLLLYWAAMMLIPVPRFGPGVLTPAGNLASYIDRTVLGRHMLYGQFDPEGLLATIPSIATALGGVFAGEWLKQERRPGDRAPVTATLWVAGVAAMLAGLLWGRVFPINKNLWTSSFALFTAGLAAQVLAACHWLLDVEGWAQWAWPLAAFGRNALIAYFLSVGLDSMLTNWSVASAPSMKALLYRQAFASWLRPCCGAEAASLAYAAAYVVLWGIVLALMYRRRVFIAI